MASEVDIANISLYRCGSSIRITTLNENVERTEAVRQAAFWYPICRDRLLQSAPWNFARKCVALALDETITYPGWQFVYQYPEDCLQAAAVCDEGGLRTPSWLSWWGWQDSDTMMTIPKAPFEIQSNGDQRVIVTDVEDAFLFYVFRQRQTAVYSPLFVDAFGWDMASEIAGGLQCDAKRIQTAMFMKGQSWQAAAAQMMNEARPDSAPDSPSIQVRG